MEVVTRFPCHSRIAGIDEAVGLERSRWSEGQDRVALFDGQIQAAEEAVAEAVAAAQDDPASPRPQHQQPAQLPPARPPGASLAAPASAGPGRHQPHQQPVGQGGEPEGEDRGGVHAHRAGQQRLGGGWPGLGWVVPGAGQVQEDAEHVDQPDGQVLVVAPKRMAATWPISHTSPQAANSSAATTSQKVSGTELCSG